jgi:hypothetical protein
MKDRRAEVLFLLGMLQITIHPQCINTTNTQTGVDMFQ